MKKLFLVLLALAVAAGFSSVAQAKAERQFVTIGTGGVTGVYYPNGGAICQMVSKINEEHGFRCFVEITEGSVSNPHAIAKGEVDMGIAQSDWLYHAYNGTGKFEDQGANKDLRVVFSLHPEPFTVVVRAYSGIKDFKDLKGRRVNVGTPGSGQHATMEVVMNALGWSMDDFQRASEFEAAEQSAALCADEIDAMVYVVGHPNESIREATTFCESVLVAVTGPEIRKLIDEKPYYRSAVIPSGMYRGTGQDIKTFGVGATLVSLANVPEDVIYNVVKAVFENFATFKKLHPAFGVLKKEEMVKEGVSAPLHDGAVRYFKEAGWM